MQLSRSEDETWSGKQRKRNLNRKTKAEDFRGGGTAYSKKVEHEFL